MPRIQDYRFEIDDRFASTYDIPLQNLLNTIDKHLKEDNLNLNPDFQRGRVWTEHQQILFCEFMLKGGRTSNPILFNHPGWNNCFKGEMVIVDGLQRLTAIMRLLNNELKVFDCYFNEFEDSIQISRRISIQIRIHALQTRSDVLRWYLQVNAMGTPHSLTEINRVEQLLSATEKQLPTNTQELKS
jgi:hypothetical protein